MPRMEVQTLHLNDAYIPMTNLLNAINANKILQVVRFDQKQTDIIKYSYVWFCKSAMITVVCGYEN